MAPKKANPKLIDLAACQSEEDWQTGTMIRALIKGLLGDETSSSADEREEEEATGEGIRYPRRCAACPDCLPNPRIANRLLRGASATAGEAEKGTSSSSTVKAAGAKGSSSSSNENPKQPAEQSAESKPAKQAKKS